MVETLDRQLRSAGFTLSGDELQAAIAICQNRRTLAVEGDPVHSISPIEPWAVDVDLLGRRK